jgi:hypothetical protein
MKYNLVKEHFVPNPRNGGTQIIYRFANDYGASVVNHPYSYGTELAVVKFNSSDIDDFNLCYNTPITPDVMGHLSPEDLQTVLIQISELPPS